MCGEVYLGVGIGGYYRHEFALTLYEAYWNSAGLLCQPMPIKKFKKKQLNNFDSPAWVCFHSARGMLKLGSSGLLCIHMMPIVGIAARSLTPNFYLCLTARAGKHPSPRTAWWRRERRRAFDSSRRLPRIQGWRNSQQTIQTNDFPRLSRNGMVEKNGQSCYFSGALSQYSGFFCFVLCLQSSCTKLSTKRQLTVNAGVANLLGRPHRRCRLNLSCKLPMMGAVCCVRLDGGFCALICRGHQFFPTTR